MKKILMAGILLGGSSSLFADYELFVTYTKPLSSINVIKQEVLFTGEYSDYTKLVGEINSKYAMSATGGAIAGLSSQASTMASNIGGAAAGLGIGIAAGLLEPVIWSALADQQFIRVVKLEDAKGNFTLKRTLLVCNKNPSLSVAQANEKMKKGN
jgi:hypothetical protein